MKEKIKNLFEYNKLEKIKDIIIDDNLKENYGFLSKINGNSLIEDLSILKKQKYKATEIAKRLRNTSIYTGAVAIVISIFLAIASTGIALTNSIYTETKDRVSKVVNQKIQDNKDKEKQLEEEYKSLNDNEEKEVYQESINELKKTITNQNSIAQNIDEEIYKSGLNSKFSNWSIFGCIVIMGLILLCIFFIIIKLKNDKAAYYETLVIMIDDRINEIKASKWDKAQKIKIKMEDGIKIKDDVRIKGNIKIKDNVTIRY
ncbi:hypothetical protein [Clostridium beijerinckii]|uniref:hypothetical protein n=1 Tax=Clostridium beijerinckii TaxID=1520 RepID=UPI0014942939|nr:hypothetical protein [Clostridium beijerinckii]NOW03219.1 CRISPR/Cas system CMR-associated protein Cmr5 small subunit [Clostridium beijerinckii]NYC03639.1 CRISPR/Cas system CMR-associated protein Cmr5 small subunit [Clostridium beijerinckii]